MDVVLALSAAIVVSVYGVVLAVIAVFATLNMVALTVLRIVKSYAQTKPQQPVRHAQIDIVNNPGKAGIA